MSNKLNENFVHISVKVNESQQGIFTYTIETSIRDPLNFSPGKQCSILNIISLFISTEK